MKRSQLRQLIREEVAKATSKRVMNEAPDVSGVSKDMNAVKAILSDCLSKLKKLKTPAMDKYYGATSAGEYKFAYVEEALADLDAELKRIK